MIAGSQPAQHAATLCNRTWRTQFFRFFADIHQHPQRTSDKAEEVPAVTVPTLA